jgi:hypothetical protein
MTVSDRYFVIPLSIQPDGDEYLVGNTDIDAFYQLPPEGVHLVKLLQKDTSLNEIKQSCAREFSEPVDVEEFIQQLIDIGLIYPVEKKQEFYNKLATRKQDHRLVFRVSQTTAQCFFSVPAILLYILIVAYAAYSVIEQSSLRLNLNAFYLEGKLTITLVLLLVLYFFTALLHELGHLLAAARLGIESKLGIGNRLWIIVAEVDLTGIFTLPKSKRYLPLLAGIFVDIISLSVITMILQAMLYFDVNGYAIQLMQALTLQIIIGVSWQFNLFLKTDIYYVLCNYCSYPDLDKEAGIYIKALLYRLSLGLIGRKLSLDSYYNLGVLRCYTAIWLLGRIAALAFLGLVLVPTLLHYMADVYRAIVGTPHAKYSAWDVGLFTLISTALFGVGVYLWIFKRLNFRSAPAIPASELSH